MIAYVIFALAVVCILVLAYRRRVHATEAFVAATLGGAGRPTLYWVVDAEKNARAAWDFGARNSPHPNAAYLQVAQGTLQHTQGADFAIVPLIGRAAVAQTLGMPDSTGAGMPAALWRAWAHANLAATKGGLVVDGASTLCLGPSFAPVVANVDAAVFGVIQDEPVVGTNPVAPGPAPYVAWAARPGHPAWTGAAALWNKVLNAGPQSWTAPIAARTALEVYETQKTEGIQTIRYAELSRHADGTPIQLEDLFGRTDLSIPPTAVYVAYDGDALARRHEFNWVLRLSPAALLEGEFVWGRLAAAAGGASSL